MARDRSVSDVLQDVVRSLQDIVRAEVRLAKVELRSDASDLAYALVWLGFAAACGLLATSFALWGAVYALAQVLPLWGATLVVAGVLAIAGALLSSVGLRKLRDLRPLPERTIATVKENLEWMKPSSN